MSSDVVRVVVPDLIITPESKEAVVTKNPPLPVWQTYWDAPAPDGVDQPGSLVKIRFVIVDGQEGAILDVGINGAFTKLPCGIEICVSESLYQVIKDKCRLLEDRPSLMAPSTKITAGKTDILIEDYYDIERE